MKKEQKPTMETTLLPASAQVCKEKIPHVNHKNNKQERVGGAECVPPNALSRKQTAGNTDRGEFGEDSLKTTAYVGHQSGQKGTGNRGVEGIFPG